MRNHLPSQLDLFATSASPDVLGTWDPSSAVDVRLPTASEAALPDQTSIDDLVNEQAGRTDVISAPADQSPIDPNATGKAHVRGNAAQHAKRLARPRPQTEKNLDDPAAVLGLAIVPHRYLSVKEVANRFGVGVATIWRWAKANKGFPASVSLSSGATRWLEADLVEFEKRTRIGQ